MVQPRLSDALTNCKVEDVQDYRRILLLIGRFKSLQLHYTKMYSRSLKNLWEDFDLRKRANKLETKKNDGRMSNMSSSSSNMLSISLSVGFQVFTMRCMNALPDDYKSLVPKLLVETMPELSANSVGLDHA